MANREAIERTRAALVNAPDHMFDILTTGSCGSPACLIGWICAANNRHLHETSEAAEVCGINLHQMFRICYGRDEIYDGLTVDPFGTATRTTAIAMCDLLLEYCDGRRVIESCTWAEAHAHEKRRKLPASITDALTAREGPLRGEEPSDADLAAAMEAGL